VPNVELLDVLGCRLAFRSEAGGFVPVVGEAGATSIASVHAVGDCAGVDEAKLIQPQRAAAEGRLAALAVALALGRIDEAQHRRLSAAIAAPAAEPPREIHGYWQSWLRAEIAVGGWDVHVCLCEEVSRADVVELRPPAYLKWGSSQMQGRSVAGLAGDGPINQDQVKRLTRAGMGPCQGRRCREQVQMLLADAAQVPVGAIPLASYRAPVRPLALGVLWPHEESEEMRRNWPVWFGIQSQFTPHWEMEPISPALPGAKQPPPSGK
jgi:hypothetical protein